MINQLYSHTKKEVKPDFLNNVREKIRTPDTLVRSQVLYPAELHAHISIINAGDRSRTGMGD